MKDAITLLKLLTERWPPFEDCQHAFSYIEGTDELRVVLAHMPGQIVVACLSSEHWVCTPQEIVLIIEHGLRSGAVDQLPGNDIS